MGDCDAHSLAPFRRRAFLVADNLLDLSFPPPSSQETTTTMNKLFLSALVVALVCAAGSTAVAADGIAAATLADMGLSSLSMMSDDDAMSIRGKGFSGGHRIGCRTCGSRAKKPWSSAFGNSFATIETEDGAAHSENGYTAEGPFAASGENFSEAGSEITNIEVIVIDGVTKSISTTCKTRVFAGGFSSAMSF
jgi:hypothetical protein